jgi:hypothetical protein
MAMMFSVSPTGQVVAVTQATWQQRLDANRSPVAALERRIEWIRTNGTGAAAKLTSRFATFHFIDYVLLIKSNDRWQIVAKIFHRLEPVDAPLNADPAPDRQAIDALLTRTLRAVDASDARELDSVYVPRAMTFTASDGQLVAVSIAEWQARFEEQTAANAPSTPTTRRITQVDVSGTAAFAEIVHESGTGRMVEYMLLLRTGVGWRLFNVSHAPSP